MSAGEIVNFNLGDWASWASSWWGEINSGGLWTVLIACFFALFLIGAIFKASASQGDKH